MKNIIIIHLLLFTTIYSQSDSVKEAMKYYPQSIGNYWEYDVVSGSDPYHNTTTPLYWLKIAGDTILSNNKSYKIIHRGYFGDKRIESLFERIDTNDACLFRYDIVNKIEYKIDSLLSQPGDRINADRFGPIINPLPPDWGLFCYAMEEKNLLGRTWDIKKMNANTRIPNELYELAKGLGFIFSESWEGSYWSERLRYAIIDGIEYGIRVDVNQDISIPNQFILFQNYPNPFNPTTTIEYTIHTPTFGVPSREGNQMGVFVTLKVYDILGREIATLVNKEQMPGNYSVRFDVAQISNLRNSISSGVYFYTLRVGDSSSLRSSEFQETRKMILLK
ncbi:MAG: hypothetical protein AB1521_03640 [Bacteroidota bacterium]